MSISTALDHLVAALMEHAETMEIGPDVPPERAVAVFERVRTAVTDYADATFESSGWGSPFSEILDDETGGEDEVGGISFFDTTRLEYDPDMDTATIGLVDEIPAGRSVRQIPVELENGTVIIKLGAQDVLLGFDVLGASRTLPPDVFGNGESEIAGS